MFFVLDGQMETRAEIMDSKKRQTRYSYAYFLRGGHPGAWNPA